MVSDALAAVRDLVEGERLGAVATVVAGPDVGAKAVIESRVGIVTGALPSGIVDDVLQDAAELIDHEQNRTLTYGDQDVFIEVLAPPPVLVIIGAGHVAQPLSSFARRLGFRVVVGDARAVWATPDRFPNADEVVVGWPDAVFERVILDHRTYLVILSHDPRFEDPAFAAIKDNPVRYIGAMGSRRTHRQRVERLEAAGWADEDIDRIHGPVGLDIGAETAEETAIAILAEIIQVRYGAGSGMSLRGTEGRIHPQRGDA